MRKLIALMLGIALLTAIFAGCGSPSPAETIDNARNNKQSAHADYNSTVQFNLKPSDQIPAIITGMPITVTAQGGADMDLSNGQHNAKGDVRISGLDLIKAGVSASGALGSQSNIASMLNVASTLNSFVMVDNTAYVKVSDTWYTVDAATLSKLVGPVGQSLSGITIDSQCVTGAMQDTSRFGAGTIFKDLQELPAEQIDGVDTRHFKGSVDFNQSLTQLAAIARDCGNAQLAAGLEAGQRDIGSLFRKADVEMWIDSNNNLRQMKTDIEMDGAVAQSIIGIVSGIGTAQLPGIALDTVSVSSTVKYSQFGATFNITKPGQASISSLDTLLGTSGSSGTGSTGTSGAGGSGGSGTSTGTGTGSTSPGTSTGSGTSGY